MTRVEGLTATAGTTAGTPPGRFDGAARKAHDPADAGAALGRVTMDGFAGPGGPSSVSVPRP